MQIKKNMLKSHTTFNANMQILPEICRYVKKIICKNMRNKQNMQIGQEYVLLLMQICNLTYNMQICNKNCFKNMQNSPVRVAHIRRCFFF